jgi:hypothetical protein
VWRGQPNKEVGAQGTTTRGATPGGTLLVSHLILKIKYRVELFGVVRQTSTNHWLQMALLCLRQVVTVFLHARTIPVETNWNSRQPASRARMSCMTRWLDPLRFTCFSYKLHDSHESTVIEALSWSSCVLFFLFLGNLFFSQHPSIKGTDMCRSVCFWQDLYSWALSCSA